MRVYAGGMDITNLIKSMTWSGDVRQVARVLSFQLLKNGEDPMLPKVPLSEGDQVFLLSDKEEYLFGGVILDIETSASEKLLSCMAKDRMFYMTGSELTKDYAGTPEAITAEVCAALSVKTGELAATGITISNPCVKKTAYQVIQSSYTAAARQNGKKYMQLIKDLDHLSVVEKGTECGVVLTSGANLTEARYKVSLQNLVNRVLITDKKGAVIKTTEDQESQKKYGTIQKILTQGDKENKSKEAELMLKSIEKAASVTACPDDVRAMAGYSLLIEEPETGLVGKFYIESDTHSYEGEKGEMSLTLSFENLMDEQELGKREEKR